MAKSEKAVNPVSELLVQALETELGGIRVYEAAIECAVNDDLREEWTEYLDQTRRHEQILRDTIEAMGLDPDTETPGRKVVRHIGESLVAAMALAREGGGPPEAAELVAAECVVHAETRDHMNWQLIGRCAQELPGEDAQTLKAAYDAVEDQEDQHLYHSKGWGRELWIQSLGMRAVLPPPEEVKDVHTAIGAAKAEAGREALLGRTPQSLRR
jgi:rubrerythrin